MPIKASILARVSKTSTTPKSNSRSLHLSKKKSTSDLSETQTLSRGSRKFLNDCLKLESFLCNRFGIIDKPNFPKERELDLKMMAWAQKVPIRYKKWETLVRAGERLQELQMFAKSLS